MMMLAAIAKETTTRRKRRTSVISFFLYQEGKIASKISTATMNTQPTHRAIATSIGKLAPRP